MIETTSCIYKVDVWHVVDPLKNGFSFFGDIEGSQTDPSVRVIPGNQIIGFTLHTAIFDREVNLQEVTQAELKAHQAPLEDQASFTTNPIQWVNHENVPMNTPEEMTVQRFNGLKFQVVNNNGNPTTEEHIHGLRLLVMHRGNIAWSRDPTIINMPPDPPGTGETELKR